MKVFYEVPKEFWRNIKSILKKLSKLWEIFIILLAYFDNFGSVLMKLSRISIKVFTKILLGLRENFEKVLDFGV